MAQFEGIQWASRQLRYPLKEKTIEMIDENSKVFAVSRSMHYALFLAFEGIRFFCQRTSAGKLEVVFLNWRKNLQRFRDGISFNLGRKQQELVPSEQDLLDAFLAFFRYRDMKGFFEQMADLHAQGYLRPFTLDEEKSIGVTFPNQPSIRAVVCRYDRYLGEPFDGVVTPGLVRAVGGNRTGCLKLGINYLMSVKAVDLARTIAPQAASALFLDDRTEKPCRDRQITEWDSSCCLIALKGGTIVKIPEGPLILPSVTIQGITTLLRQRGVQVQERYFSYGELLDRAQAGEVVAICSIGTAGILNRCNRLFMVDEELQPLGELKGNESDDLYHELAKIKELYWGIYQGKVEAPESMNLERFTLDFS
jgi:branched-chain amino acid aminotransferase